MRRRRRFPRYRAAPSSRGDEASTAMTGAASSTRSTVCSDVPADSWARTSARAFCSPGGTAPGPAACAGRGRRRTPWPGLSAVPWQGRARSPGRRCATCPTHRVTVAFQVLIGAARPLHLQQQRCFVSQAAPDVIHCFPGLRRQRHRGRPVLRISRRLHTAADKTMCRQVSRPDTAAMQAPCLVGLTATRTARFTIGTSRCRAERPTRAGCSWVSPATPCRSLTISPTWCPVRRPDPADEPRTNDQEGLTAFWRSGR